MRWPTVAGLAAGLALFGAAFAVGLAVAPDDPDPLPPAEVETVPPPPPALPPGLTVPVAPTETLTPRPQRPGDRAP